MHNRRSAAEESSTPREAWSLPRRAALLAACVAAGSAVGAAGHHWWGGAYWIAAVPIAVAVGWLAVADPTRCEPRPGPHSRSNARR